MGRRREPVTKICIPGKHRNIDKTAFPVDKVQKLRRITEVVPAVSCQAGRYPHPQQAGEIRPLLVRVTDPVFHRVLMAMQVDKSGADHQAGSIRCFVGRQLFSRHAGNFTVFQQKIQLCIDSA